MKKTLFALTILLSFAVMQSQPTNEEQIRVALNDYIDGSSYNKVDQILKAFADNATLYLTNREGEFKNFTPQEYTGFFKNGVPGKFNGRVGKILSIEIDKDIATARAEIVIAERESKYIDLFLLKHIDGKGWKIISKTATQVDYGGYVERDKKLDNFTLQRLLVLNDAGDVLMEQGDVSTEQAEPTWYPLSLYSTTRQSITEAMDSLALSHGIKISKPELRAYTTYKFSYHNQVSFRSYYVAKYVAGSLNPPKDGITLKWLPVEEAVPHIPVEAIRLITKQVLEFPENVWGGSFLISENGEQHDTLVLEDFYPLFGTKL
ncbi:nuclear transport factor 2 family protein [Maribacter halichondriae]|uniref:nuclear transport factor 2 family protein n=1 Tax=Maribacter halichondriae TaxID=2980554 RepID=UPI00235A0A15|nr:nuclear transport factor 2 family protein [Maribacter sp. Hal144]